MNTDAIDKFVKCLLDSAQMKMAGPTEANLPLFTAQEIKKKLTNEEYRDAARRSVVELLKHNFPFEAMAWLSEFKEFPELINDNEIKQAAEKSYQAAKNSQYEGSEELKTFFKI